MILTRSCVFKILFIRDASLLLFRLSSVGAQRRSFVLFFCLYLLHEVLGKLATGPNILDEPVSRFGQLALRILRLEFFENLECEGILVHVFGEDEPAAEHPSAGSA